ncbi:hypothetical protein QR680_007377 [Steinernema hermaphroditum]|uniref:Homeobox domain-containing protein n=1 Tax=Steinernema hermaphroditum TaxID=289476 RepID=A0AA39M626_9BILA|nr:hypothetical protein QR680_007377 [Steinernema hermaphroditum]
MKSLALTSIEVTEHSETARDFFGHFYRLENATASRTLGYCAEQQCRALLYVVREPENLIGYLVTNHKCGKKKAETNESASDVKLEEKTVQTENSQEAKLDEEARKCLFQVEVKGKTGEKSVFFDIVKKIAPQVGILSAIQSYICESTAPITFVEVSRWDSEFEVYSKLNGDEILTGCCDSEKYRVICHTEEPRCGTYTGWMMKHPFKEESIDTPNVDINSSVQPCSSGSNYSDKNQAYQKSGLTNSQNTEKTLEEAYLKTPFPDTNMILDLALVLNMSLSDVRSWFSQRHSKSMGQKRSHAGMEHKQL